MLDRKPRFRCRCGFLCYSRGQERYHRNGLCRSLRRTLAVMAARERTGQRDHMGLVVDGISLKPIA